MNGAANAFGPGATRESWLPTLQLAAQEVFELMLGCRLEIPVEPPAEQGLEITSMVGMAGRISGILAVRCSSRTAAQMASRMLCVDAANAGPQMWDALGEICNMVAGNFKNKINGLGDGCMLSVPTVITGGDYSLHALVNEQIHSAMIFEGELVVLSLELHS